MRYKLQRRALMLIGILGVPGIGCSSSSSLPVTDPFADREPTRFHVVALIAASQTGSEPRASVSTCAIPIRGGSLRDDALAPETGLAASLSRAGSIVARGTSDAQGYANLATAPSGVHLLELTSGDELLAARLPIDIRAHRTELFGVIRADAGDVDADGDRSEWHLAVEVLPDGDGDGVSDTGTRSAWYFGNDGGVAFEHRGRGTSARLTLDAGFEVTQEISFADLDGDFLADAEDPDADGDGVADANEPDQLHCPGVSHAQYETRGSAHANFTCDECHLETQTEPLWCEDCHTRQGSHWEPSIPDDRPPGHFERGCQHCHVPDQPWQEVPGRRGEHHNDPFPLDGRHLTVDCFACHVQGLAQPPTLCDDCHRNAVLPGHATETCDACHSTSGWLPPTGSHDQFPLAGGHADVACTGCHTNAPVYTGLSTTCASCHQGDAPQRHGPAGFGARACDDCHTLASWTDHNYQHDAWQLRGTHPTLACDACHVPTLPDYTGLSRDCQSCHADDRPTWPDHTGWGTACAECHAEDGWLPVLEGTAERVDHSVWPLTDSHATALCTACHGTGGSLEQPPRNCAGCHEETRPARHDGTFDGECDQCHQTTTWADLSPPYDHPASFPLEGTHADIPCADCHPIAYQVPAACDSCHAGDAPADHYGAACGDCHDPALRSWEPTGDMNHHTADPDAFPLTGGHDGILCSACHTGGFSSLPAACESCHTDDRPAGHATSGCANCHTASGWQDADPPQPNAMHPLEGRHSLATCVDCHGAWDEASESFQTPQPPPRCDDCHTAPSDHISIGGADCGSCHGLDGWLPATGGGHDGTLPTANFPYDSWSGRWFPVPHHRADVCDDCHTDISGAGYAYYSCTWQCHSSQSSLNKKHDNGQDSGSRPFHLYHFSAGATHSPANEGGAPWPTAHVGCVESRCHNDGREP